MRGQKGQISMEKYLAVINTITAIILSYIALGEHISKLFKIARNKITHYYDARSIVMLIIHWFEEVDSHITTDDIIADTKIDKLEKEIAFQFKRDRFDKSILFKSSKRFRKKYLHYVGLSKSACTIENYLKYAHIKNIGFDLSLELTSSAHHRKYTKLYFPLSFYWTILHGNYIQYLEQNKNNAIISDDSKIFYSDIEMPIRALRMYYKV